MVGQEEIKVSVCVITYNHQAYIRQCLESIATQIVDFDFEIIVADDCSTDNTRMVILDVSKKFPGLIKTIFHDSNIGVCPNYLSAHKAARGKYVAHCDGDDFWYQGKLAKQVRIMDADPSVVQCWTCADVVDDQGAKKNIFPSRLARFFYPDTIYTEDIVTSYALVGQHSTQLYRRSAMNFHLSGEFLDYWVAYNISLYGKSIYLKDVLSAYRVTSQHSVTRNNCKNKAAVDLLSKHLVDISRSRPDLVSVAKANIVCRYIFSRLKGHNLNEIERSMLFFETKHISLRHFLKSLFYFAIQKIL